jgi:hypothetical protein
MDRKTEYLVSLAIKKAEREYRKAQFKYILTCAFGWLKRNWHQRRAEAKKKRDRAKIYYENWRS